MEHRPYQPVLSTGQARMPTLPKARMPALPECLSLPDAGAACTFTGILQREAGGVKTGINYETKPTSLLEST